MSPETAAIALIVHIVVVPILMVLGCVAINRILEDEQLTILAKKRIMQEDAEFLPDALFWEEVDE